MLNGLDTSKVFAISGSYTPPNDTKIYTAGFAIRGQVRSFLTLLQRKGHVTEWSEHKYDIFNSLSDFVVTADSFGFRNIEEQLLTKRHNAD